MSTLAQITTLEQQAESLRSTLVEVESESAAAKKSLRRAKQTLRHLIAIRTLRKPLAEYSLWKPGVLIVGPVLAIAIVVVLLVILGLPAGFITGAALLSAAVTLGVLLRMFHSPVNEVLPSRIAEEQSQVQALQQTTKQLSERAESLRQQIAASRNSITELRESDRLKRELLLEQNWKAMRGIEWEEYLVQVFEALGAGAETTPATGDQGVDLLVRFGEMMIAVQAKGYVGAVGNDAVQQVVAGKVFYDCDRTAVITNSRFTASARALASAHSCFLIGEKEFPNFVLGSNLELFRK